MSTAAIFNRLGQSILPRVLARVLPDTCTITAETTSAGTGGGRVKSGTTNAYTSVPCAYEPIQKFGWQKDQADRIISTQVYKITLPTHTSAGTRINLSPTTHKIVVTARGTEPAKTFQIMSIGDDMGNVFECICSKEN